MSVEPRRDRLSPASPTPLSPPPQLHRETPVSPSSPDNRTSRAALTTLQASSPASSSHRIEDRVLTSLNALETLDTQQPRSPDDSDAVRRESRKVEGELQRHRTLFVEKASLFATIYTIGYMTGKNFNTFELLEIMRQGSTVNRLSGEKPKLWDVITQKPFYKQFSYWQAFKCWITCHFLFLIISRCLDNFMTSVLEEVSQGVSSTKNLSFLGDEFAKILNLHLGKYLKAIQTFALGQDTDGSLRDHIAEELSTLKKQTEHEIYAEFSKVLARKFLPDFPIFVEWRKSSKILDWIVWIPILICNLIYKTILQWWIFPSVTKELLKEGSNSAQFRPFAHALNKTIADELFKIINRRPWERPRTTDENAVEILEPHAKQNIEEAVAKLLEILQLDPLFSRADLLRALNDTQRSLDLRERTFSHISHFLHGKTVNQIVNDILQKAITEQGIRGLNDFLDPIKAKQLLKIFMEFANNAFDREAPTTLEELKRRDEEYKTKKQIVLQVSNRIIHEIIEKELNEFFNPSSNTQTRSLNAEAKAIKDHYQAMVKNLQEEQAAIQQLENSTEETDLSQILQRFERMKNILQNQLMNIFGRNRNALSNEAQQRIDDSSKAIQELICFQDPADPERRNGLIPLLAKMKEHQMNRSFRLEFVRQQVIISQKLQRVRDLLEENSPLVITEMQQVGDILQGLRGGTPSIIAAIHGLRGGFRALVSRIHEHEVQKAVCSRLESLASSTGPLHSIKEIIRKKLHHNDIPSLREWGQHQELLRRHLQELPDASMRNTLSQAIANLENSSDLAAFQQNSGLLEECLTQQKREAQNSLQAQKGAFPTPLNTWNVIASRLTQNIEEANGNDQTAFREAFQTFKTNLGQLETLVDNMEVEPLSTRSSTHRFEEAGATWGSTLTAAGIGAAAGIPLGPLGVLGGAIVGGLGGNWLGSGQTPATTTPSTTAATANQRAPENAFNRHIVAPIQRAGASLRSGTNRVLAAPVQAAGALLDRGVVQGQMQASGQIRETVMPIIDIYRTRLYQLLQEKNMWQGFFNASMQSFSRYYLKR